MDLARTLKIIIKNTFTHLGNRIRHQVTDCIHQATGTHRHHGKTQFLKSDEYPEIHAKFFQQVRTKTQVVHRMFHAYQVGRFFTNLCNGLNRNIDRGTPGNMIDHNRQFCATAHLDIISSKAPLGWTDVIGSHHQ